MGNCNGETWGMGNLAGAGGDEDIRYICISKTSM